MHFPILFLLGLAAASNAPYTHTAKHELAGYGCMSYVSTLGVTFCLPSPEDGPYASYYCPCFNKNAMATMMGCMIDVNETSDAAYKFLASSCVIDGYNATEQQFRDATEYFLKDAVPMSKASDYNETGAISRPLITNSTLSQLYVNSNIRFYNNYDGSLWWSLGLMGYWILVLLLFAANRWAKYFFPGFFVRKPGYGWMNKLRRYILVPSAFGGYKKSKQEPLRAPGALGGFFAMLMPSRAETFALIGFFVLSIVLMAANIEFMPGDPQFTTRVEVHERYLADRTGIIATICVPMLILFGGRNNFLQWLTGMNFASFITIHRWISRMFLVMVVIHSILYSVMFSAEYTTEMAERYCVYGIVATTAGGLIFAQSLLALRRAWYEIFLVNHILLAVAFVVGTWIHVDDLGFVWFMYVATGIWAFDRLLRLCRIFWFGFPKADVTLVNGDTLKVVIPKPKSWVAAQGGYAYVYFLRGSKFFQSHPFTYLELGDNIRFYVKVKEGVTRSFHKKLASLPSQTAKVRVSVEGPYGGGLESASMKHYHTALFFAGGNGIPGMFSEAYHLGTIPERTQKVKLVWVVRDYNWINVMYEELEHLKESRVECVIYVTRPENSISGMITELCSESDSDELSEKKTQSEKISEKDIDGFQERVIDQVHSNLLHIEFRHGRPLASEVIEAEIEECEGSLAISTCGHPEMVDNIRDIVADKQECGVRVDFYEHLQVWA